MNRLNDSVFTTKDYFITKYNGIYWLPFLQNVD